MATTLNAAELKKIVKELNVILKSEGKTPLKVVGPTKTALFGSFLDAVQDFIDEKKEGLLSDSIIDYYNDNGAEDESDTKEENTKEEKPKTKSRTKSKAKTTPKPRTRGKAGADKKSAKKDDKGPGVVELAVKAYREDGLTTTKDIVAKIEKNFPGRNISSTVSNVVCVLGHVND